MELVKEPGFSNKVIPRSAAGTEGRMWLLLWFLQGLKCVRASIISRRKCFTHTRLILKENVTGSSVGMVLQVKVQLLI